MPGTFGLSSSAGISRRGASPAGHAGHPFARRSGFRGSRHRVRSVELPQGDRMILLYHHVAPREFVPPQPDLAEGWSFTHTPEGFERQLRELDHRGWEFMSLPQMVGIIRQKGHEPDRAVAITFDDGWRETHRYALPILTRLGRTATFFLTTEHFCRGFDDAARMNPAQVRDLLASGMTVGGHTRTHPDLTKLEHGQALDEIAGCKADLERSFGQPVTLFAYPRGAFNRGLAELTRQAGYECACSVLSPAQNDRSSLYWLFRDVLTEKMNTAGDRYRLSPLARRLLAWRVRSRLRRRLGPGRASRQARSRTHRGSPGIRVAEMERRWGRLLAGEDIPDVDRTDLRTG